MTYTRAVLLNQGQTSAVLVALDLAGITINVHIVRIRRDVSSHLRIPKDRVLVACTYTHASPDLQGLCGAASHRSILPTSGVEQSSLLSARPRAPLSISRSSPVLAR